MSASTFKILKQCLICGKMFEAQKTITAYCSHKCNSQHYKLKKKLERKGVEVLPISEQAYNLLGERKDVTGKAAVSVIM